MDLEVYIKWNWLQLASWKVIASSWKDFYEGLIWVLLRFYLAEDITVLSFEQLDTAYSRIKVLSNIEVCKFT